MGNTLLYYCGDRRVFYAYQILKQPQVLMCLQIQIPTVHDFCMCILPTWNSPMLIGANLMFYGENTSSNKNNTETLIPVAPTKHHSDFLIYNSLVSLFLYDV